MCIYGVVKYNSNIEDYEYQVTRTGFGLVLCISVQYTRGNTVVEPRWPSIVVIGAPLVVVVGCSCACSTEKLCERRRHRAAPTDDAIMMSQPSRVLLCKYCRSDYLYCCLYARVIPRYVRPPGPSRAAGPDAVQSRAALQRGPNTRSGRLRQPRCSRGGGQAMELAGSVGGRVCCYRMNTRPILGFPRAGLSHLARMGYHAII